MSIKNSPSFISFNRAFINDLLHWSFNSHRTIKELLINLVENVSHIIKFFFCVILFPDSVGWINKDSVMFIWVYE